MCQTRVTKETLSLIPVHGFQLAYDKHCGTMAQFEAPYDHPSEGTKCHGATHSLCLWINDLPERPNIGSGCLGYPEFFKKSEEINFKRSTTLLPHPPNVGSTVIVHFRNLTHPLKIFLLRIFYANLVFTTKMVKVTSCIFSIFHSNLSCQMFFENSFKI